MVYNISNSTSNTQRKVSFSYNASYVCILWMLRKHWRCVCYYDYDTLNEFIYLIISMFRHICARWLMVLLSQITLEVPLSLDMVSGHFITAVNYTILNITNYIKIYFELQTNTDGKFASVFQSQPTKISIVTKKLLFTTKP